MLFLYIFLFVLPFAYTQDNSYCTFDYRIFKPNRKYYNCLQLGTKWAVAVCLLQANSLEGTMQCAGWEFDEAITFNLAHDEGSRDVDLIPSYDRDGDLWFNGHQDGKLMFTPRGLILAASYICSVKRKCDPSLFSKVKRCPFEDMAVFLPCLKCHGVTPGDMEKFNSYIRGRRFGSNMDYDAIGKLVNWNSKMNTYCPDKNGNPLGIPDDDEESGSETKTYAHTFTMRTTYPSTIPTSELRDEELEDSESTGSPDRTDDEVLSTAGVIAGSTTKINREKPSQTGDTENGTGRQTLPGIGLQGMIFAASILSFANM